MSSNTEFAGVCWAPNGQTMFVNLYSPGMTLAVTGPWERFRV
ncbi:alkaline phosphatase PhoX [Brevundimonas sp. 2P06AA]